MASISILSSPTLFTGNKAVSTFKPSASLVLRGGSTARRSSVSLNAANNSSRSGLLHCSLVSSSLSSLSFSSSFSGSSVGLDMSSGFCITKEKRRGFVVKAGRAALCQTKRNRSRKSLARVHGFRRRMRTTSGRAVLKRRRAKGRWMLCTKSNSPTGK